MIMLRVIDTILMEDRANKEMTTDVQRSSHVLNLRLYS